MAQFNPITDLMPIDSSEESVDKSSEQIESIRIQLIQTRDSLSNVVNIIKVKNSLLERDLDKIENLNERLKRTIPRIPIMRGMAGVQFGDLTEEKKKRSGLNIPMLPPPPPKTKEVTYKRPGLKAAADAVGNIFNIAFVLSYVGSLKSAFAKVPKVQAPVPANQIVPITPGVLTPKKEKLIERILSFIKTKKLARTSKESGYLAFSKKADKLKPKTLVERMTKEYEKNFGKEFNPVISRRGKQIRANALFTKKFEKSISTNPEFQYFDFLRTAKLTSPNKLKGDLNKVFKIERQELINLRDSGKINESVFVQKSKEIQKTYLENMARIERYELETRQQFKRVMDFFKLKPKRGKKRKISPLTKEQEKLKKESDFLKEVEMYEDDKGGYIFKKINQFIENVKQDNFVSLNTDTGVTNTVIIFTNPPTA